MRGATVTILADRRTPGVLDLARNLTRRLRGPGSAPPVPLWLDPSVAREVGRVARLRGEHAMAGDVQAMLSQVPPADAVFVFRGPIREEALAALDRSHLIVVACDDSVFAVRSAQRTLMLLTEIGYPVNRVEVALLYASGGPAPDPRVVCTALRRDRCHLLARVVADPGDAGAYDALVALARRA